MNNSENHGAALMENRFWLQIMGDHARFILYSLAPTETEHIQNARQYISIFDQLMEQARRGLPEAETSVLNKSAYDNTYGFREFKLQLLALTLESKLKVHLSSTFINHMLNELEEYLRLLDALLNGQNVLIHPLHHHLLWLPDAAGHAAGVADNLDGTEKDYYNKAKFYEQLFTDLYLKAIEVNGFTRTKLLNFASLRRLNEQSASITSAFKAFLEGIRDERSSARLLGTLLPLMADHMAREECYYLTKLSESAQNIKKPDCDPARKRIEI
jgi:hypothetical protein